MSEIEERLYTIPFYPRLKYVPRTRRAKRAVGLVKEFILKHVKKADKVLITPELNEYIWARGIEKPPRKVRVSVEINEKDAIATVYLVKAAARVREPTRPTLYTGEEEIEEEEEEEEDVEELSETSEEASSSS